MRLGKFLAFDWLRRAVAGSDDRAEDSGRSASPPPRGDLAICAIMKNEARNVVEWIAYHRAVGVDKFYLYDNGSTDDTVAVLQPLVDAGLVELTDWPQRPGQIAAYEDFARRHGAEWTWAAFIDLDEFITIFDGRSIVEWLVNFSHVGAVALQWMNFGPAGYEERPRGLQIEAFNKRVTNRYLVNGHVKCLVRMERFQKVASPHAFFVDGPVLNELSQEVSGGPSSYDIQETIRHDEICINHYYTRSREDWARKIVGGCADNETVQRSLEWFDLYVRDATIVDERIQIRVPRVREELAKYHSLGVPTPIDHEFSMR